MNEIFGIQVCRRLFDAPKRKRPKAASSSLNGGMLANLVPESQAAIAKKIKSRQDNQSCQTSVLADIGRYNSPPRSNKELKETSSSVMAMGYSDSDKKDAKFSVFEMICQQETRSVTSGVHRPSHRTSAKRRRTQQLQKQDSCLGQLSSKTIDTLSVLEDVKSDQNQMVIPSVEVKSKRRGKRERRVVSRERMKPESKWTGKGLASVWYNCAQESSGCVTEGDKSYNHSIPISSAKHKDAKAVAKLCREGKDKAILATQQESERQVAHDEIVPDNEILERRTHPPSIWNVPLQERELPGGSGSRVLSFEQLDLPAGKNLLGLATGSSTDLPSPAVDESMLAEAAITLLQLSASTIENEEDHSQVLLKSPSIEGKENAQHKGRRKKRNAQAMSEKSLSTSSGAEPKRRSARPAVPTQRFSPVDMRRRSRLTDPERVKALKTRAPAEAVDLHKENAVAEVTDGKDVEQRSAMESASLRRKGLRQTSHSSARGDSIISVEPTEGRTSIFRQLKKRETPINGIQSGSGSRLESKAERGGPQEWNMDEAGGRSIVKRNKPRKSDATADSPSQRRSSRLRSQTATATPPHKIIIEDDFFDSMQKESRVKSASESEESIAEHGAVKMRGHKKKTKRPVSHRRKGKDGAEGYISHAESSKSHDDAGGGEMLKAMQSNETAESSAERRSSRLRSQAATSTPPHKIIIKDDFFDSITKLSRAKSASEGKESIAEQEAVPRREHRKKAKGTDSHSQKGKHGKVGKILHFESNSDDLKGLSKKAAVSKPVEVQYRRRVDEPNLVDVDGWTPFQIASLRSAYANADPCSDQFWEHIANQIDGQGEDECRTRWFSLVDSPAAKKTQARKAKRRNDAAILHCEVDVDDLFNSTPMRVRLRDDDDEAKKDNVFDIDFGSPIVVDESHKGNQAEECDDEGKLDATAKLGYSKTFIKNLKRDISKGGKEKARKKVRPIRDAGPRGISSAIDYGDLEVKGTLSPGGTMQVRTIYWNGESEEDDIFDSDEEQTLH